MSDDDNWKYARNFYFVSLHISVSALASVLVSFSSISPQIFHYHCFGFRTHSTQFSDGMFADNFCNRKHIIKSQQNWVNFCRLFHANYQLFKEKKNILIEINFFPENKRSAKKNARAKTWLNLIKCFDRTDNKNGKKNSRYK